MAGVDVDHVEPHHGDQLLMWDQSNWGTLCHSCHSTKTMAEQRDAARLAELQAMERRGMELQRTNERRTERSVMVG